MKLPRFIYTRRWLVIMGLAVTLACLVGVLLYVASLRSQRVANDTKIEEESSTSAQESTNSAQLSETSANSDNNTATSTTEDKQVAAAKSTMQEVEIALETKNGPKLYNLLSSEMQSIFTPESVVNAFAQAEGIKLTTSNELQITGEWAKQEVSAIDASGKTMRFLVVLHLEDGSWKLYGTDKLN